MKPLLFCWFLCFSKWSQCFVVGSNVFHIKAHLDTFCTIKQHLTMSRFWFGWTLYQSEAILIKCSYGLEAKPRHPKMSRHQDTHKCPDLDLDEDGTKVKHTHKIFAWFGTPTKTPKSTIGSRDAVTWRRDVTPCTVLLLFTIKPILCRLFLCFSYCKTHAFFFGSCDFFFWITPVLIGWLLCFFSSVKPMLFRWFFCYSPYNLCFFVGSYVFTSKAKVCFVGFFFSQ